MLSPFVKKNLHQSDYFLIVANLLPVIGVWAWGWSPKEVFVVYCLETIIIGMVNLVKMGIVTLVRKNDTWYNGKSQSQQSGLFFMFFFLMHYGFFVSIQMGLFLNITGIAEGKNITFSNFIYKWPHLISQDTFFLLGVFVFCYCFKMLFDFIYTGEYRRIPMALLMFQPYGRVFIQQITVIVGSLFLTFGAGKIFILIFALVKILFEIFIDYDNILNNVEKELEKNKKQ